MHGLKQMLLNEQKYLENILTQLEKKSSNTLPQGCLRISVDGKRTRYYQCINDRYGTYIPKGNLELARQLAQKTYYNSVKEKAASRLKLISKCLIDYSDDEIEQLYESLHSKRQALITPLEPTAEQLEKQWYEETYRSKEFHDVAPVILTEKGERVRSKSEKILADFFYRNNILYKYEKPLTLVGYGTVYPDFTFFSKKLRKEIYWEHEGMMDKAEYARSAVKKINTYQTNGIYPGERLILTFETEQEILNSKIISELTDKYLK
ncbi:MAG: hypothetical protein K6D96_09710 [Acetatifactor sp.]|nr:hypothetical protein [Acetatifactor sp.]